MKHLFPGNAARVAFLSTLAAVLPVAGGALASQVTLKSSDGTVNLVGEYVEFVDDHYVIRTALGDLRISAGRVRCEGAACPDIEVADVGVVIAGSELIGEGMMPLLMSGFAASLDAEAEITNTSVEGRIVASLVADGGFGDDIGSYLVSSTSTDAAFDALMAREAQIAMASRRILPAEAKKLRAAGAGNMVSSDQERVIAMDSLVIVTHPSNPVDTLAIEDLQGIYSGRIANWSELGGPDAPIRVIARAPGSATRTFFEDRVFDGRGVEAAPGLVLVGDDQEMAAAVNDDPAAIGYVGYAFQRGSKPLTLVNECGIEMSPDAFSAKTEEYALGRRMYLYNRSDDMDAATRSFLDFAISEDADGVVAKSGFIDLSIERRTQGPTDARAVTLANTKADAFETRIMQEMLAEMAAHDRLSTTFRFRSGSSKMDEKARFDMERLIRYLETMPAGTEVTLVGFTDEVGAFEANRRLSIGRADQVRAEIQAASEGALDGLTFNVLGFGEIAPAACNATETGRAINRRVEVWVRSLGA